MGVSSYPLSATNDTSSYDAKDIIVLGSVEGIRKCPAMYIGSTGSDGLHQLLFELIDNSVDEFLAGHCGNIWVILHTDGSCSVQDDGRGIPVALHPIENRPAAEVVLTKLHSGAKFSRSSYRLSGGLHGIGLTTVNALSEWLKVDIWRDGRHYSQEFRQGIPLHDLRDLGEVFSSGTRIHFLPDRQIFPASCQFSFDQVLDRAREVAFLNSGIRFHVEDRRCDQRREYSFTTGIKGLVRDLNENRNILHEDPIYCKAASGEMVVEAALQWTSSYTEKIASFANGVKTPGGGTHVDALKRALTRAAKYYLETTASVGSDRIDSLRTSDILEGLAAVLVITLPEPQFDGQIKSQLANPEAAGIEEDILRAVLKFFTEEKEQARPVIAKFMQAWRTRVISRRSLASLGNRGDSSGVIPEVYRKQFGIRSKNWHDSCTWLTDSGLLSAHAEMCKVPAEARMLDVCCGSGVVGAAFGDRVAYKVGLDITPEMRQLAKTRLNEVREGSVYNIPFEEASFEIVVTREVLHILPGPQKALAEIYRVLKPGGQIVVGQTVPYGVADAAWMFCIFEKKQPLFCNHLFAEDVTNMLLQVGFRDVEIKEQVVWESIDLWIDTHETGALEREEIRELFYNAPDDVREKHPFDVSADGKIRDQWRWCIYSATKPK
jgi:DNA gyrase subunit B